MLERRGARIAAAALSLCAALAGGACGGAASRPAATAAPRAPSPRPSPACQSVVTKTLGSVAIRAYRELQRGRDISFTASTLAHATGLGDAIARGDSSAARGDSSALAAQAATAARGHYTRLQISRGGRVLAAAGRAASLAPVRGAIRDHSGVGVARFAVAALSASNFAQLVAHLTDARVEVAEPGRPGGVSSAAAPSGTTAFASTFAFFGEAFPSGPLRVTLRIPAAGGLCGATPAATVASTIGGVAQRIYANEVDSAAVRASLARIAADRPLVDAVARGDRRATRAAVTALVFGHSHIVRLRVTNAGRLLADVGGPQVLAPRTGTLRDASGATVGEFVSSLQDDLGLRLLTRRFTGAQTLLRIGERVLQGRPRGASATLPDSGPAVIGGVRYNLVSFMAQAFPSGPLRVTLIVRAP